MPTFSTTRSSMLFVNNDLPHGLRGSICNDICIVRAVLSIASCRAVSNMMASQQCMMMQGDGEVQEEQGQKGARTRGKAAPVNLPWLMNTTYIQVSLLISSMGTALPCLVSTKGQVDLLASWACPVLRMYALSTFCTTAGRLQRQPQCSFQFAASASWMQFADH